MIIGSGFAGLSAAVELAAQGRRVVVVEEAPRLGGRATSFTDRETGERVDNGQHVLFGCYTGTYRFLKQIGTADLAPLQPRLRLTMADGGGRRSTLVCPALPAPWHLIGGLMRWDALGWGDRLRALRIGLLIRGVHRAQRAAENWARPRGEAVAVRFGLAIGDGSEPTVSRLLDRMGQPRRLCDWLWNPLAVAALNQSPDVAAALPFVRVLAELFGPHPDAAAVGLPVVPLDDFYAIPAKEFIEAHGGRVMTRASARIAVDGEGRLAHVRAGPDIIPAATVISAVPWHAVGRIWDAGVPPALTEVVAAATALGSSPIVTVNLWFDGPVMDEKFIGLVGGPMHWVFNKSALFGDRTSHLSIVSSGATALVDLENREISDAAVGQLHDALPASRNRSVVRSVVVREHRATFSLAPGSPTRPGAQTALPGFFLAGDWTDTGLPGTIEGAVRSGQAAARAVVSATGDQSLGVRH